MGLFVAILLFLVTLVGLGWAGWQVAAYKTATPLDGILGFMLWVFTLVVLYSTLLSFFYALSPPLMCFLAVGGAGCTWFITHRYPAYFGISGLFRRMTRRFRSIVFAREGWIPLIVFIILAVFGLFSFITALAAPEVGADNLAYHLPRLGYWLQFRAVLPFLSNNPRIGTFPATGNILQLVPVLFLRSDRFCGLIQLICCYGTGIAIFGISRKLGATISAASLAALLWFSIPSVLGQITISLVDIIIAFFVATSVYFVLSYRHNPSIIPLIAAFVSCSLAVGVKSQAAAFAVCIGLYCVWQCRFYKPLHRLVFAVVAFFSLLFLALPFYIQNYFLMHSISGIDANQLIHIHPSISSLLKNAELILAPTFFWFWFSPVKNNADIPYHTIFEASRAEGVGLIWLVVCVTSMAYIVVRLFFKNRHQIKPAVMVVGFGMFFLTFILFVMRHQPSVNRFSLAALPIITPASALFLDSVALKNKKMGFIVTTLIVVPVIYVLQFYALDNFLSRLVPASRPAFLTGNLQKIAPLDEESRYYDALSPFARAVNEMSNAHGIRIGLLTPQYFREGFAFGNGYTNIVVPLSYNPPQTTFDLDTLQLDALWISAATGNQLQLWRVTLPKSVDVADESWQVTTFKTYDRDFLRAHEHAVFYQDISPILSSLTAPASDWHLVLANEAGLLFAKGRETAAQVSISGVINPNVLEQLQDRPFFWIGQGDTTIQVFSSQAGTVNLVADFIPGPSLPGSNERQIKVTVNGKHAQNITLKSGLRAIPVAVGAGNNLISITPLDNPTVAVTGQGDTRPLILGVKDLHVEASP